MCEIRSKLTIKTQNKAIGVFKPLTYFTPCSSACIVDFQQVNADWDMKYISYKH